MVGENPMAMPDRDEPQARPAPASVSRIGLALILAVYLALAALQSLATRLQWGPDEPAHIVYVRSLASRGHLGGLSRAAGQVVDVLDAVGFDRVLVETVGVGQG
ncbi:MAG: hypothetical protein MUQ26_05550, partial [Armatimonadetes bacterium]|nr:hypothetical protein [Armatimonadota bacterium]